MEDVPTEFACRDPALVVVDLQRYYLDEASAFARFHEHCEPGCLDYIRRRCQLRVLPNVRRLLVTCRAAGVPVMFLRLCGLQEDRSDLQRTFREIHHKAADMGFSGLYPLASESASEIVAPLEAGQSGDRVFCKTTYSAFTSSPAFVETLDRLGIQTLIFTGLATSQCVETTARDAADRNYRVVHIDDAQADYSETSHRASLFSSQGVCGGRVVDTETMVAGLESGLSFKAR